MRIVVLVGSQGVGVWERVNVGVRSGYGCSSLRFGIFRKKNLTRGETESPLVSILWDSIV